MFCDKTPLKSRTPFLFNFRPFLACFYFYVHRGDLLKTRDENMKLLLSVFFMFSFQPTEVTLLYDRMRKYIFQII